MNKAKSIFPILGLGITIGAILVVILVFGLHLSPRSVTVGGVEFDIPTPAHLPQSTLVEVLPSATVQKTSVPTFVPTLPPVTYSQSNAKSFPIDTLKQVLDETSTDRVEITIGRLREFCYQGIVICTDYPSSNWSVIGPAVIATDPLQQPINGAYVIKVNKDSMGNWLPNWPIGLFYIPEGQKVLVPAPGVAYLLEEPLPAEWVIR